MLLPNNLNSKLFVFCTEAANMTDERFFQKDFKSMSALGRNFKVGDLYNYYNDLILPSGIKIVFITFSFSLYYCYCDLHTFSYSFV